MTRDAIPDNFYDNDLYEFPPSLGLTDSKVYNVNQGLTGTPNKSDLVTLLLKGEKNSKKVIMQPITIVIFDDVLYKRIIIH